MQNQETMKQAEELQAFLEANPDVELIEALVPDVNGVLRGKRVPRSTVEKIFKKGIRLPLSVFALDIWGHDVPEAGLLFETGDGDGTCFPVPGSLQAVPWLKHPTGQILLSMQNKEGEPFYADPRVLLQRVLSRFDDLGLTPVVATELEFYLLDAKRNVDGSLRFPESPLTGGCEVGGQLFRMDQIHDFEDLFFEFSSVCKAQGIPVDTLIKEGAPYQFELNLNHQADAVMAADHAVLLKRAIKGISAKHGLVSTFMAKPLGEESGNGLHIHFSLLDREGRNVFADGGTTGTPMLMHAVAGLAATMKESMAIFAPNANSYRRFQPGCHAPLSPAWGYDNRTTALRIPGDDPQAIRVEHRVSGADANPYLVLAIMLAGAHYGIVNQMEAPPVTSGDAYALPATLPNSWELALNSFDASTFVREYLGDEFHKLYSACKWQELWELKKKVSSAEYDAYLRTV